MDDDRRAFTIEARAQHAAIPRSDWDWLKRTYPKRAARLKIARPTLAGADFAYLTSLEPWVEPKACPTLPALARRVHRLRRGGAIQCENAQLEVRDQPPQPIVNVYALDDTGSKTALLCHAYLRGDGMFALMAALERIVPQPPLAPRVRTL